MIYIRTVGQKGEANNTILDRFDSVEEASFIMSIDKSDIKEVLDTKNTIRGLVFSSKKVIQHGRYDADVERHFAVYYKEGNVVGEFKRSRLGYTADELFEMIESEEAPYTREFIKSVTDDLTLSYNTPVYIFRLVQPYQVPSTIEPAEGHSTCTNHVRYTSRFREEYSNRVLPNSHFDIIPEVGVESKCSWCEVNN